MFNTSTTTTTTTTAAHHRGHQLLEQVSMFANAVNRLSQKKQAQGELTRGEQGLLEANTHLLRQRVLELHGLPIQLPSATSPSSHHIPLKKRPTLKQRTADVDEAASLRQPAAGGTPPRTNEAHVYRQGVSSLRDPLHQPMAHRSLRALHVRHAPPLHLTLRNPFESTPAANHKNLFFLIQG
jgi:hypothetical protein